jgi:hypothetical protein
MLPCFAGGSTRNSQPPTPGPRSLSAMCLITLCSRVELCKTAHFASLWITGLPAILVSYLIQLPKAIRLKVNRCRALSKPPRSPSACAVRRAYKTPVKPRWGAGRSIGQRDPLPFLAAAYMPQQKILEDEFPLAGPQRTAANTARYLMIIGFWASLNLDDVVERAAMRTFKKRLPRGRNVRRFARDNHGTPPRCCNEHRRYVFGGPWAIRCKPTLGRCLKISPTWAASFQAGRTAPAHARDRTASPGGRDAL